MIFLNSVSSAAALVFYLPGVCTHTDTEGKQRKARVRNIIKSLEKNTIFNEHPLYYSVSSRCPGQIHPGERVQAILETEGRDNDTNPSLRQVHRRNVAGALKLFRRTSAPVEVKLSMTDGWTGRVG